MAHHALAKTITEAKQGSSRLHVNTVDGCAHERLEITALVSLQKHREQKHFAKLPITSPGLALWQGLKRRDINKHRLAIHKLYVVRGRILQYKAIADCPFHQV